MKDFKERVEKIVEQKKNLADKFIKERIEPLLDELKHPDKVIGKDYEEWTEADRNLLKNMYSSPYTKPLLEDFIFNKEYKKYKELQEEEYGERL